MSPQHGLEDFTFSIWLRAKLVTPARAPGADRGDAVAVEAAAVARPQALCLATHAAKANPPGASPGAQWFDGCGVATASVGDAPTASWGAEFRQQVGTISRRRRVSHKEIGGGHHGRMSACRGYGWSHQRMSWLSRSTR